MPLNFQMKKKQQKTKTKKKLIFHLLFEISLVKFCSGTDGQAFFGALFASATWTSRMVVE